MRGQLSEVPFTTVLRRLADDRATGTLTIAGLDGPGQVLVHDGRVIAARSPATGARIGDRLLGAGFLDEASLTQVIERQRRGELRGRLGALLVEAGLVPRDAVRLFVQEQALDAMLDLVRWRWGDFAFQRGLEESPAAVPVAMDVADVLLVVERRRRDWDELARVIPDLAAVPTFTDDARTVSATLEPDEFAVLASVDGDRDLHTLAADLGYHEFELTRIVYGLVQLGVVDIRLPEDEIGAALDAAFAPPGDTHDPRPGRGLHEARTASDDEARVLPFRRPGSVPGEVEADQDARPVDGEPATADQDERQAPARARVTEPGVAAGAPASPPPDEPPATRTERPSDDGSSTGRDAPPAAATPHDPSGTGPPAPPDTAPTDGPPPAPDTSPDTPPTEPTETELPPAADQHDADVSEFLRELSRLAGDDSDAAPTRPPRTPPARREPDEPRPKRRGLFGRG